jgi:L-asparagine oxygenase
MKKLCNSMFLYKIEIQKIQYLVNAINACPFDAPHQFCDESKKLSNFLPKRIKQTLVDFHKHTRETGCMMISNIPLVEAETNINTNTLFDPPMQLYKTQSLFVNAIPYTEMLSYEAEGGGKLFQNIFPKKSMANEQTSLGSTELEIHSEQAFSKVRPDILSLACLRGDSNAMTYILPVNTILGNMDKEEIELLKSPLWNFGVDLSFKINNEDFIDGYKRGPYPIITGVPEYPLLRFDQDLISGITDRANALVKKIIDIYYKHRITYNLKPGEMLLIDNHRAVHGRSQFYPKYDGNDRFLTRCFGMYRYRYQIYEHMFKPNTRMVGANYS